MTQITPETLTFEILKSWDGPTMREQLKRDGMRDAVMKIVTSRSLSEVEQAQEQIDAQTPSTEVVIETTPEQIEAANKAAELEAQRVAAEAEAARVAALPKKIIKDYQVKDEDGNPIGRPTHLEASSWEEMAEKMQEAHTQATRAFHRLKKQKVSFKEPPKQPVETQDASDAALLEAMKDLKSDDPKKQLEAFRKVQQAEQEKKDVETAEFNRQREVSRRFIARHKHDFNNCQANIKLIEKYFLDNPELRWDDDNLEICLHALEFELAPPEPVVPVPPVNPVVTAPVVAAEPVAAPAPVQPAAVPAVQPVVTAPVQVPPANNPPATTVRPGVNGGGLQPGQGSGSRPSTTAPKGLTAEEIRSWDGPTMRAKMRNPVLKAQIMKFFEDRAKNVK